MKYKYNDYYGYINKIQEQAIRNPQWFWSDDSKASEARQWLYNNGASKIVDEIYENTPEDIKKNIDSKKLSTSVKTDQVKQNIYEGQKKFLDTAGAVGATTLPLIAAAPAIITAPGAMIGGLVGGVLGAKGTDAAVRKLSNNKYSNWGDFISKGKYYGETLNTLIDFTNPGAIIGGGLGAKAGNKIYSNLSNRYTFNQLLKNGQLEFVGPKTYDGYHQSDKIITEFKFPFKERWDVKTHNADPNGVFFSEAPVEKGFLAKRPVTNKYTINSNKALVQHGDIYPAIDQSKNGLRNYIVKQARKNGADIVRFENIADNQNLGQNVLFALDKNKIKFKGIDPKIKMSEAERLGIPKGERNSMSRNQKEALEDLKYLLETDNKNKFVMRDGKPTYVSENKPGDISVIQDMLNKGAEYNEYKGFSLKTPEGYVRIFPQESPGDRIRFGYIADNFPTQWGDATTMPIGDRYQKIILTSPHADMFDTKAGGELVASAGKNISKIIPKEVMKGFWKNINTYIQPGTYLSGDEGSLPMGYKLYQLWKNRNSVVRAKNSDGTLSGPIRGGDLNTFYNLLTTPEKINGRAEGLSTDSYMAILKQGNRPGHKLRFSNDGFTKFNNQGVENKFISDMLEKAKTGKISKQDFVKAFNDWVKPYNGEPAIIKGDEIIIPHPFVLYKNGGKLNK